MTTMSIFKRVLASRIITNPVKLGNRSFSSVSVKLQKAAEQEVPESNQNVVTFTSLPETHQMLKDTCRQFAEAELWPIARDIDR